MVSQVICGALYRIVLPLALLAGILFRQNVFSLIYLLLLLLGPLLPGISATGMVSGHPGRYLRATLCISILLCLAHITFQITLLSLGNYGQFIDYCTWMGKVFSLVGLHRLDNVTVQEGLRLVGLDLVIMITSAAVYITCSKLTSNKTTTTVDENALMASINATASVADPSSTSFVENTHLPDHEPIQSLHPNPCSQRRRHHRLSAMVVLIGELLILVLMAGAGILAPSLLSSIYFLIFLIIATWLACNRTLGRKYLLSRIALMVYCALHFIAFFSYQTVYAQEVLPPENLYARLLGLTPVTNATCANGRSMDFLPISWTIYVSPLLVLCLYWLLATATRCRIINASADDAERFSDITSASGGVASLYLHGGSKQGSQRSSSSLIRRRKSLRRAKSECMSFREYRGGFGEYFPGVKGKQPSEMKPLLEDDRTARFYRTLDVPVQRGQRHSLAPDLNGSMVWSSEGDAGTDDVPTSPTAAANHMRLRLHRGQHNGPAVARAKSSKGSSVISLLVALMKLIARGSYVCTLIIMMTWSITYHSWLTFVLLLWSCVLWMTPNSRRACLRSSPFLVAYAEALLLLQYLYGLDLHDDELPQQIETVNLAQIGLVKYHGVSYQPLAVKILYTLLFWLTLHQYVQEKRRSSEHDLSHGMLLEPFHISFSTAQPGAPRPEAVPRRQLSDASGATAASPSEPHSGAAGGGSGLLRHLTAIVKVLLTKYWIWIVACMLMVISLGGQEVVLYRVAYMFLFLFFITMFQFSYRLWRRVMYAFWLTMIVYSMLVLILIYTYQFEGFPGYWENYLHVPPKIQSDIGLEVYESDPGTLFLKLLTPTFFLIITIIQLHYFHKDFLKISDINYKPDEEAPLTPGTKEPSEAASPTGTIVAALPPYGKAESHDGEKVESPRDVTDNKRTRDELQSLYRKYWSRVVDLSQQLCEMVWRVLEIHMAKIVLFSVLCLAANDVCAIHFVFVLLVVVAMPLARIQTFAMHGCSLWASVLLLSKMIYQLSFVDSYGWTVNCTVGQEGNETMMAYPRNDSIDNRIWIGFKKTENLTDYCKGYIGLIIVMTIQAVVRIRQRFHRFHCHEAEPIPGVVFEEVTRAQADDGILSCAKFLINYFFYKFGVEWCFVTIVACIGVRLDVFAVLSSIWLCIMILMPRRLLGKMWAFYVIYQCIVLPIQYLMCVGIPLGICIDYPWSSAMPKELQEWLYLPDFLNTPNAYKILVDFFQLIFSCCQLYVFSIENGPDAERYGGGSNAEIYLSCDRDPDQNPVPDFVTKHQSYLDMAKSVLFFGFYWVTLAIVFLAGTSRVSLFAMGYVIGCFVFLWSGNEFYLKPIKRLLKMWNGLLAYNVAVILIKSILQVLGCVFFDSLYADVCWLAQLLGMACLKKLTKGSSGVFTEAQHVAWCCQKSILRCSDSGLTCPINSNVPLPPASYDPILAGDCQVPSDEAGLLWDGVCFAFLLLQKRLFCSNYFQHLVQEIRAQQMLASRGAEMIQEIQQREVKEQEAGEQEVMAKIKKKMDRIRARHQKSGQGAEDEGAGGSSESGAQETHFQAIRSGDYYMFDEYSDDEMDPELRGQGKPVNESEDEETAEVKEKGINALLSQAMKGNLPGAGQPRCRKGSEEEVDDVGESSQMSPIARPPLSRVTSLSPYDAEVAARGESAVPASSLPPYESSVEEEPKEIGEEEEPVEVSWVEKVKGWLIFAKVFLNSCLISATAKLNAISKDYRYVARQLATEKMLLKEQFTCESHTPTSLQKDPYIKSLIKEDTKISITLQKGSQDLAESIELVDETDTDKAPKDYGEKGHPTFVRFLVAIYYAVVSRSELLCYLMIIINQMKYASFLSLPLPLMAFLWGSLSVPRPSKTFWITIITYTEAIIVIKCLFQFDFYPWNRKSRVEPFLSPFVIGIEQTNYGSNIDKARNYFVVYDLALLMVVFFHRFMLKSLGLWKDTSEGASGMDSSSEKTSSVKDKVDADKESLQVVDLKDIELSTEVGRRKSVEEADGSEHSFRHREGSEEGSGHVNDSCLVEDEDDALVESSECAHEPTALDAFWTQMMKYTEPVRCFFRNLLYPEFRVTVDVYAFMFFCDFINFLIIVFGYWAFGTGGGDESGVASYFQDNKVPVPFLIMLIANFALIVIDRALYLRKQIFGKMIFQVALVFIVHIWMFFILPAVMEKPFAQSSLPPKLWYFNKCVYLLLSSYQIRSGYPTRILGNFFCKKYNYINLYLFKGYLIIPFLYELRCLMDWMWTDTSMNIGNWLKMEDIFANIFVLKCNRRAEEEYPTASGSKRTWLVKYGVGGFLLFLIILIIWFPLLLFALGNTVGLPNYPSEFSAELTIGSYEPVFKMAVQGGPNMRGMGPREFDKMLKDASPRAIKFIKGYDYEDVTVVSLNSNSTSTWSVSPPSQLAMINDLADIKMKMKVKFQWRLFRNPNSTGVDKLVIYEQVEDLDPGARYSLATMLNDSSAMMGANISAIFPNYLKASARAITSQELIPNLPFRNLNITLHHGPLGNESSDLQWWEVRDPNCMSMYSFLRDKNCNVLRVLIFSDKVFPSELSIFSGYGIVGLYTTFVLLVSRLVRGFVAGMSFTIMFDDMPYVNRILQLCLDIYLVRESGEFNLEEDLFAKLIFLYRSPETLIKWTRYPTNYHQQLQQQQQEQQNRRNDLRPDS